MSTHTPFIPAALDDADLTPHEFRVFCRVCRRGECTESVGKMAKATGMHPDTVRKALKTLIQADMVARTDRPGTTNMHEVCRPESWDLIALEEDHPSDNDGGVQDGDPCENDGGVGCENEGGDKFHPSDNDGGDPCEMNGDHPSDNDGGASKGYPLEGNPPEGAKEGDEVERARETGDSWQFLPKDEQVFLETMRDSAEEFSPSSVDMLVRRHWGGYRQGQLPSRDLAKLVQLQQQEYGDGQGFRRFVAGVVITGNLADTPNLKFLRKVLDNFDRYRAQQNGHASTDSTERESASGWTDDELADVAEG